MAVADEPPTKGLVLQGEPVEPGTVDELGLPQLLVYADHHAPAIRSARARARRVDATEADAAAIFPSNPELTFGAGPRLIGDARGLDIEAGLSQRMSIAGERGLLADLAAAERSAAMGTVDEARWEVHLTVHQLYVDLLLAKERRELADKFVTFAESLRDITARQVEAGEIAPLVLLVAETDLAQTKEAAIETQRLTRATRSRLSTSIGWPQTQVALPVIVGELPDVRRAPELDELLGLMTNHHPSLKQRDLAVVARRAELELANRRAWPEPTLGIAWAREAAPGAELDAHLWLASISVPLPLWRTNDTARAQARAEVLIAETEREETAARLRGHLTETAAEVDSAVERVELYSKTILPQLEKNLELLIRAYELGEVDVHQVSQTRKRLLDAAERYLEARIAYFVGLAALEGLVGTKLWP